MKTVLFACYGHLRFRQAPLFVILVSSGIYLRKAFRWICAASFGGMVAAVYFAFRF